MEFNEKLQELRKKKGITQDELATQIYVSRTAISKWESGRGYPSIESLKAIASFFSVTVDELLSPCEALTLAEEDGKKRAGHTRDLIHGLLDIAIALLLFIPLFAVRGEDALKTVSLIAFNGVKIYLKIIYLVFIISTVLTGIFSLALQNVQNKLWEKYKIKLSLLFSTVLVLLFIVSLQPYAAVLTLSLLIIKVISLVKM